MRKSYDIWNSYSTYKIINYLYKSMFCFIMVALCYNLKSFRKVYTIHCIASLHLMHVQFSTLYCSLAMFNRYGIGNDTEREFLCFIGVFDRALACDV